MSLDSKAITFAAVFTLHVEREFSSTGAAEKLRATPFHCAAKFSSETDEGMARLLPVWTASVPMNSGPERKQPLMLPAPKPTADEQVRLKRQKDPRYPRQWDLVIYNTERMPSGYVCDMLQRVFHENAEKARFLSFFQRHIHEGPFTHDVAHTKADQVRKDASDNGQPAPHLRFIRH